MNPTRPTQKVFSLINKSPALIHLQGVHISVGWGIIGQDFYHTFFSLPLEPPAGERETARQSEVFEATCNRGPIHSCTPLHLAHSRSSIVMC